MIAVFAVALRVGVFLVVTVATPISLARYTAKGDTTSYIAVAAAMTGERSYASLAEYDRRVFPGYPAMIAIVHLAKIPLPIAALLVTWLSAGIAAAAAARAFADARVGWAMTCLIPHYLINSSLGMSEAPMLAMVCVALVLWQSDRSMKRTMLCGVLFGLAALIRPMACFAAAGVTFALLINRRWSRATATAATTAITFTAGVAAMQLWTGNALQGVHVYANHPGAYAGHMVVWPFRALIIGTRRASLGRNIYIWLHVTVTLLAVVLVTFRVLKTRCGGFSRHQPPPSPLTAPAAAAAVSFPWLLCNTAMVLCIGPPWGFMHFPRFTIPAAPAMFWTLRGVLPRDRKIWYGIGLACFGFAVIGVIHSQ